MKVRFTILLKGVTMKSTSFLSATSFAALALFIGNANAGVTVTFTEPEKFADMPFNSRDKETVMADLHKHFDTLGATLPAGQDLKVEILDIDLAGRIEPFARATQDLRILRGSADWPIITLRYRLESQGQVLKSGEERIADMSYLQGYNHYNSGESLRYEKQMIDRWFKKTLLAPKAGG
jgi:hypothetical protein